MKSCSPKRIAIAAAIVLVLAAIIAPLVYYTTKDETRTDEEDNKIPENLKRGNSGKQNGAERTTTRKSTPAATTTTRRPRPPTAAVKPVVFVEPEDKARKVDCYPEATSAVLELTREKCEERGCEYVQTANDEYACFFKDRDEYGFSVVDSPSAPGLHKFKLSRKGKGPFMENNTEFQNPVLEFRPRGRDVLQIKLYDEGMQRYEVPMTLDLPEVSPADDQEQYQFEVYDKTNFAFRIRRRNTGVILFDTGVGGLTLTDKFLQLATKLPSNNLYGFGENVHFSFRHDLNYKTWPMFGRDQPTSMRNQNYSNLYGTHPFYTCVEDAKGNTHGVLLLNSNAQDYSFTPLPMLTYRTIGGILDFYMFLGPTPEMVIQQYTKAIGRPFMPPYWALGFQLSRYGYNNLDNMKAAVDRMKKYNIPQDVQTADIDHMDEERDFTIDPINFKELPEYFRQLRDGGMHTITILDPFFISNNTNYEPYEMIKNVSGAVMWGEGYGDDSNTDPTGALLGWIWPNGKSIFPDFFKNKTKVVWKELIKKHIKRLHFDALWIDMNEPASFDTNKERAWNWPVEDKPYWNLICPHNEWDDPPYRTMAAYGHDNNGDGMTRLSSKTICMVATQGDGNKFRHYDVHSLYGWSQSGPTLHAMREATGKRSMVLSRSTFPGSGRYAGHWLGDNDSSWSDLRHSIIGMLEFGLFGIPYIGADICGFMLDTTAELCLRWMQLGAFYPFSRNHNGIGVIDQDPGALGERVANASREALETRYWLLPYLYTLFHHAHTKGTTVARPLHHEFPNDTYTLGIYQQFLWGSSLLVSPITSKGQNSLNYYLPQGIWYDFYTNAATLGPRNQSMSVTMDTPIQLHVRGGSVLALQEPALNTTFSRRNPMKIRVFMDEFDTEGGTAEGDLFWDDGESIDSFENGNYFLGTFKAVRNMLRYEVEGKRGLTGDITISSIEINGVNTNVSSYFFEGKPLQDVDWKHDAEKKILLFENLNFPLSEHFAVHWYSADLSRIDCYPERLGGLDLVNKEKCEKRNCIYDPSESEDPDCFFPQSNYGYKVDAVTVEPDDSGLTANLTWMGTSPFGSPIENVVFKVQYHGDDVLRFTLDARDQPDRYKVPIDLDLPTKTRPRSPRYQVSVSTEQDNNPFNFKITRRSSGAVLWDTSVGGLTFEDQFLQIATKLPSTNIYGFGENIHAKFRHDLRWKQWPMFSRDEPTGDQNARNHYGVHPFYTCVEDDGQSHGVLLLNSNAQDYAFTPLPMLIYRTIGGILDFYMFLGPEPENVIQQYTSAIGKPHMPPYWSLGFQLCRYGYNHIDKMKEAVDRTAAADIPHDVQYADIDHMDTQMDFTIAHDRFPGLNQYFKDLQEKGMKTIIILDPCLISNVTGYEPYDRMFNDGGSIKWPADYPVPAGSANEKGDILGFVWPQGKVIFPDFFLNETEDVWKLLIKNHHDNISFDGLWIDMNEPANFGTNEKKPWNWPDSYTPYWSLTCNMSDPLEAPPYRTMAAFVYDDKNKNRKAKISDKTVCMVGHQGPNGMYRHYDVHSLYGLSQTKSTLDGLRSATPNKRGLVISRSTFPGSGKYSGHWLGDNSAVWPDVHLSIVGMLEFNLFGIPYIGADICGFFGNTTSELCKRWMQLGAFYTFSRNHNGKDYIEQDPAVLGEEVAEASRQALRTRYELLPYLYTLFHHSHIRGGTVIRPLHHEFPTDRYTYGIDEQFMWGKAILISPILYEGQKDLQMYLPKGSWYDYYTGEKTSEAGLENRKLSVEPMTPIQVHIRGGNIIPVQAHARNTTFSRKNPFTLKVGLKYDGRRHTSVGDLFWDDGESIDTYETGNYYYTIFDFINNKLKMMVQHSNDSTIESLFIEKIQILGSPVELKYAYINGTMQVDVHEEGKVYEIRDLDLAMTFNFDIEFFQHEKAIDEEADFIDCFPDFDESSSLAECKSRRCISQTSGNPSVPSCVIDNENYGYTMISSTKNEYTQVDLEWKNFSQMFEGDFHKLKLEIRELSDNVLQVKFLHPTMSRYEVPVPLHTISDSKGGRKYNVTYFNDDNNMFALKVSRLDTRKVIFDTSIGGLTFADQFLQLVTRLPSKNVYGMGENRHFTFRHDVNFKRWPMFSRDNGVNWGDYANLYGVHPFYMCVEDDIGNSHAVLLLNSNAMEILLQPAPALTYRTVGGVLDFYLFLGPTPEQVIQQYTELIGRPYFPPYWALGFQLSRYGYNNIDNMMAAVNRTLEAGIPYDVQYADIDHMDERKDFTIDSLNFQGLKEYVEKLHDSEIRFIIILDPALISNETNYYPYNDGLRRDVFIKWPNNTINPDFSEYNRSEMLGYVWPKGKVVFPDFFKNETRDYWIKLITTHHNDIKFDGLWIDMNEPANFGTNEGRPFNWPEDAKPYWTLKCPVSKLDDPPYKPRGIYGPRLSDKTLCMVGKQGDGKYNHYDVHSLYGWSETEPTLTGLRQATGKRGIVISRSTYPSSGTHAGHWLGDNESGWRDMHDSIIGIMEFNLFGIPYIGADICGFFGDSEPELCERWMQLGAFYTFSRNHNTLGPKDQDPAFYGPAIADSSRRILEIRYTLLPYLYTLFYHAHIKGSTVIRSMVQNFPYDKTTWDIDTQFMWGSELLIIPVLKAGEQEVLGYFPSGRWFDFRSGEEVLGTRRHHILSAPRDYIPLFVRGGSILLLQAHAVNTNKSRTNPFGLIIAPDGNNNASGYLFWDDGESIDTIEKGIYFYSEFQYTNNKIDIKVKHNNTTAVEGLLLNHITVYGMEKRPINVQLSMPSISSATFQFDFKSKVLNITDIDIPITNQMSISIS